MLSLPKTNIIDKLIQLSKIFKNGFTVIINNEEIYQYSNTNKPYVISYQSILEIHDNTKTFKDVNIPNKCIIGGWLDKDDNIFYIELNKIYANKYYALKIAKKHKQKYIYDLNNSELIKVV